MKLVTEHEFNPLTALVLTSGSIATASVASFFLAGIMMGVIILSRKININPDNVATPIAASLGDLVTLSILASVCTLLYNLSRCFFFKIFI